MNNDSHFSNPTKTYKFKSIRKYMEEKIKQILMLAKRKAEIDKTRNWSRGSETFFEEIKKEIEEAEIEAKNQKQIFLEDELGDIFWDYMNLLVNLENEKKINFEKVFERSTKKYAQRINAIEDNISWDKIKKIQKEELKKEQAQLDQN